MNCFVKWIMLILFLPMAVWGCDDDDGTEPDDNSSQGNVIFVNPSEPIQTMEGFGASDSWRVQFVGKNWPVEKRNAMADLLFSQEFKEDGSPEGIGLSLWRFNIGAGSAEQGADSDIDNPWRRAGCFLKEDGTYDWNKQEGQQWFLQTAKDHGVESFLAYMNSPPVHYTQNGKAYAPGGKNLNLKEGRMPDFAEFLATVCKHFEDKGLSFDYLSPVNEPQWDWDDPGQEGSPATNEDIAELVRELSPILSEKGVNTHVVVPEAAELQFLYGTNGKPERQEQIDAFFHPSSDQYIGDLDHLKNVVLGHSYFTTAEIPTLVDVRRNVGSKINEYGGEPGFWQSEFCILEESDDIGGGWSRDLGMGTALYVARVIHFDITLARASSWSWWTALTQGDYKDGLIYLDNGNSGLDDFSHPDSETLQQDGEYRESKLLWALGNYSRFVRPGMQRVKAGFTLPKSQENQASDIMFSAFKDAENEKLVLVFVNYSDGEKDLTLGSLGETFSLKRDHFDSYTTSETKDLEKGTMPVDEIKIGPRSVVTLTGEME